ncbi:MAG: CYTH domain-containing protein [Leptolyngbya sp. Prado105]|jgi:CYTH domain-containing protein|nr:CYTH domain-containing protein [Leptolyngbya sp. Prado105]
MGIEIERKFLVIGDQWRNLALGVLYRQGYIPTLESTVRIRIAADRGFITIKGRTQGISRSEFEYEIPLNEAAQMLDTLCKPPLIEKYRHKIELNGMLWEVDEFLGQNQGLTIAEVELQSADQSIELPEWIGEDVSHDPRYYNSNLAQHPFSTW